jgi:hypothetical protein
MNQPRRQPKPCKKQTFKPHQSPKKGTPYLALHKKKKKQKITIEEEEEEELKPNSALWSSSSFRKLFSSSRLDDEGYAVGKNDSGLQILVVGGGTGSIGGGCSGRGSDGGDGGNNGGSGSFEGNILGSDNTDAYYQKMIEGERS